MSKRAMIEKMPVRLTALLALAMIGLCAWPAPANGPIDAPVSSEPRVEVALCKQAAGLMYSEGNGKPWKRIFNADKVHSRDVLMVLPGLQAELFGKRKSVKLTLWGNL